MNEELIKRGATVFLIPCYSQEKPTVSQASIQQLLRTIIHAIISTSVESLENLISLLSSHRQWLQHIPVLAISDRMQTIAQKEGFLHVIKADNATESAIPALQQV